MAAHRRNAGNGIFGGLANLRGLFNTTGNRGARGGGAHRLFAPTRPPRIVRGMDKGGRHSQRLTARQSMATRPSLFGGSINAKQARGLWWRA